MVDSEQSVSGILADYEESQKKVKEITDAEIQRQAEAFRAAREKKRKEAEQKKQQSEEPRLSTEQAKAQEKETDKTVQTVSAPTETTPKETTPKETVPAPEADMSPKDVKKSSLSPKYRDSVTGHFFDTLLDDLINRKTVHMLMVPSEEEAKKNPEAFKSFADSKGKITTTAIFKKEPAADELRNISRDLFGVEQAYNEYRLAVREGRDASAAMRKTELALASLSEHLGEYNRRVQEHNKSEVFKAVRDVTTAMTFIDAKLTRMKSFEDLLETRSKALEAVQDADAGKGAEEYDKEIEAAAKAVEDKEEALIIANTRFGNAALAREEYNKQTGAAHAKSEEELNKLLDEQSSYEADSSVTLEELRATAEASQRLMDEKALPLTKERAALDKQLEQLNTEIGAKEQEIAGIPDERTFMNREFLKYKETDKSFDAQGFAERDRLIHDRHMSFAGSKDYIMPVMTGESYSEFKNVREYYDIIARNMSVRMVEIEESGYRMKLGLLKKDTYVPFPDIYNHIEFPNPEDGKDMKCKARDKAFAPIAAYLNGDREMFAKVMAQVDAYSKQADICDLIERQKKEYEKHVAPFEKEAGESYDKEMKAYEQKKEQLSREIDDGYQKVAEVSRQIRENSKALDALKATPDYARLAEDVSTYEDAKKEHEKRSRELETQVDAKIQQIIEYQEQRSKDKEYIEKNAEYEKAREARKKAELEAAEAKKKLEDLKKSKDAAVKSREDRDKTIKDTKETAEKKFKESKEQTIVDATKGFRTLTIRLARNGERAVRSNSKEYNDMWNQTKLIRDKIRPEMMKNLTTTGEEGKIDREYLGSEEFKKDLAELKKLAEAYQKAKTADATKQPRTRQGKDRVDIAHDICQFCDSLTALVKENEEAYKLDDMTADFDKIREKDSEKAKERTAAEKKTDERTKSIHERMRENGIDISTGAVGREKTGSMEAQRKDSEL